MGLLRAPHSLFNLVKSLFWVKKSFGSDKSLDFDFFQNCCFFEKAGENFFFEARLSLKSLSNDSDLFEVKLIRDFGPKNLSPLTPVSLGRICWMATSKVLQW